MGSDEATAIANELYRYAELVDAGRFDEVGELMEHCTFSYGDGAGGPSGAQAIADMYRNTVITYDDGTPRTRHITANPIIETEGDTATVRSVYIVLQQAPDSPMQAIITGRYHDTLRRIDGRWRFVERRFLVDLVGDLSRHLRFDLSP
ncbi:MAG: nuclear transport factor 2 family protein [Acidimicrobiaceae bacterium]|nr:nuclear transport factor 2 family protein [Acidimicrobiaceae bacterium]MYL02825.1 nuclear transport factor 2 family protein [Acidimicrobiaceae bacterium]